MRFRFLVTLTIACGVSLSGWGASKSLTVCTENAPEGFDMARYQSTVTNDASSEALYDRLLDFERGTTRVIPSLAERYQVSRDGLSYTFYLRQGVRFHRTEYFTPTRTLNADDVLFTFQRMLDRNHPWYASAPSGYPFASSLGLAGLIKSIDKQGPYVVRFTLQRTESPFIANLAMGFASILSKEYADQLQRTGRLEDLNTHPIGSGPFLFKRYDKDATIRYQAHADYWRGAPRIENLYFSITPDHAVRIQRLLANECQIAIQPKPESLPQLRSHPEIQVNSIPALWTMYVAPNTSRRWLSDKRFRQALWMAMDKAAYIKAVLSGNATPAWNPIPPGMWSYSTTTSDYPYDLVKARKLIKASGYDGSELVMLARTGGLIDAKKAAELLQADWAKIGVKLKVVQMEWGEVLRRTARGEHDLALFGWVSDNGDPDNFLTPNLSCAAVASGGNRSRWCNPDFDMLLSRARASSDIRERARLYEAAQQLFHEEAPWIPTVYPMQPIAMRKSVRGFVQSPFGSHNFYKVYLTD